MKEIKTRTMSFRLTPEERHMLDALTSRWESAGCRLRRLIHDAYKGTCPREHISGAGAKKQKDTYDAC